MVMVLPMQPLTLAGLIRGFAEALVLAEAEVGAEAWAEAEVGAAVAAEAGGFGSRFKLAFNCRKDGYYAKREWNRTYRPGVRYWPWYGPRTGPG